MPSLGQTSDESRIVAWLKSEGDNVAAGEPILEVETDKAILQIESTDSGTVLSILRPAGDLVQAGQPIAYVGRPGETLPASAFAPALRAEDATGAKDDETAPSGRSATTGEPVLATPVARKLAKDHGIDVRRIRGSGPGGLIEKRDVQAFIDARVDERATPVAPVDIPVPRHRQIIARRLTRSIQTIPQITLNMTARMRAALALVSAQRAGGLAGLTATHLIMRSVARMLRAQPHMNRLWHEEGPTYRQLVRTDVGLAVANDDNLLVATIAEPDRLDWPGLVRISDQAIRRARGGTLAQADTAPTAIAISNLGMHGVDSFGAIVDPDQSMILAVGRIVDQPIAIDGGIHILPQMTLSLTVDHRIADGVAAAAFLGAIRDDLERIHS
jgi:pyruvate dehydrogenase E2 component (dihydrolipoamide acetyltransferase)